MSKLVLNSRVLCLMRIVPGLVVSFERLNGLVEVKMPYKDRWLFQKFAPEELIRIPEETRT